MKKLCIYKGEYLFDFSCHEFNSMMLVLFKKVKIQTERAPILWLMPQMLTMVLSYAQAKGWELS